MINFGKVVVLSKEEIKELTSMMFMVRVNSKCINDIIERGNVEQHQYDAIEKYSEEIYDTSEYVYDKLQLFNYKD